MVVVPGCVTVYEPLCPKLDWLTTKIRIPEVMFTPFIVPRGPFVVAVKVALNPGNVVGYKVPLAYIADGSEADVTVSTNNTGSVTLFVGALAAPKIILLVPTIGFIVCCTK